MPGSGKSLVSSVASRLGIPVYVMGDIVREEAARQGLEPTPENLSRTAVGLREVYGPHAIALLLRERLRESIGRKKLVVVDGMRSLHELSLFEELAPVCILAVHAPPMERFNRLKQRSRPGDPASWEEFVSRDLLELGWGVGRVIALADYVIVNDGEPGKAMEKARNLLETLLYAGSGRCQRRRASSYLGEPTG